MLHVQSAIAARKQEIERGEISPLCKPITFDHRFCVAPMVGQVINAMRAKTASQGGYAQAVRADDLDNPS